MYFIRKYIKTFTMSLQEMFLSRANILLWLISSYIPSIISIFVWLSLLGNKVEIGGFTKLDFIKYYLYITIFWYIIFGSFSQMITAGIQKGELNYFLTKPYSLILKCFVNEFAFKVVSIILTIPLGIVFIFLFKTDLSINLTPLNWMLLIVSIILGSIIWALLETIISASAFWTDENWAVRSLHSAMTLVFAGFLVPASLLPANISIISDLLPYKYIAYLPISLVTDSNKIDVFKEVSYQVIWIFILFLVFKFIWRIGTKRYSGTGG